MGNIYLEYTTPSLLKQMSKTLGLEEENARQEQTLVIVKEEVLCLIL